MMKRPAYQISEAGICLPVRHLTDIEHDGDTVPVATDGGRWRLAYTPKPMRGQLGIRAEFPGGLFSWRVRLLQCWCRESDEQGGAEATAHCRSLLARHAGNLDLWIPMPERLRGKNPLILCSFTRVLGHIYLTEHSTLSAQLVAAGYATKERER